MNTSVKKIISLLSIIRGYNIFVLIVAQYLAAIFIFSDANSAKSVLIDKHLLYLIIATTSVVAGGYIINNFYDVKSDHINRPIKSGIDNLIKQETQLALYFILNFTGFLFGSLVSWRSTLFFSIYIFFIWFYSHKLKKKPIVGLFAVSCLTITPFLILFIYYKNFSKVIFIHASFLFLLINTRELIKDLENIQGAIINNYQTFTVRFGEKKTKELIYISLAIALIPLTVLYNTASVNSMKYFFLIAGITLIIIGSYLNQAKSKNQYRLLHNILKLLLLIGVFSLLLIDRSLLLDKII